MAGLPPLRLKTGRPYYITILGICKTCLSRGYRQTYLSETRRAEFYRFLELLYNRVGRFSSRNGGKACREVLILLYILFENPVSFCPSSPCSNRQIFHKLFEVTSFYSAGIIAEYDPFPQRPRMQPCRQKRVGCRARRRRHELFAGAAGAALPARSCPHPPPSPAGRPCVRPRLLPVPARGRGLRPAMALLLPPPGATVWCSAPTPDAALWMEAAELLTATPTAPP